MRHVLVSFEVSVSQRKEPFIASPKPDYSFTGEFDKDDDKSLSELFDMEYKVEQLVKVFKDLGCQVIALRKEVSHLELK